MVTTPRQGSYLRDIANRMSVQWNGGLELRGAVRAAADGDDGELVSALIGAWASGGWEEGLAGVLTARSA